MATRAPKPSESAAFVPPVHQLPVLAAAARGCTACELHSFGTQTVFGEGPPAARLMLVGEQPGDKEDLAGRPFVGPAGRLLDEALVTAGLDREHVYITNAVKHFYFEERGKQRLHKKPKLSHVRACHAWLDAELDAVKPRVIVVLGATAAQALMGGDFRITTQRGQLLAGPSATQLVATYHPSAIIRMPDKDERAAARAAFESDLTLAAGAAKP